MPSVYTIGWRRKPLSEFIGLLREAGVDAVIDVRLRNTSHLSGFTKRDDLQFLLETGFGISYEHRCDLAPDAEILDEYRENENWQTYENLFRPLLVERQAADIGRSILSRYQAPCLLCSEPCADQCHRRLIAEYWAAIIPDLTVVHL